MARSNIQSSAGGDFQYYVPVKSDGNAATAVTGAGSAGKYTLASSGTYYVNLSPTDALSVSIQLTTYTAGLILTSVAVETCIHGRDDVTDISSTAGEWTAQNPPSSYVPVVGAGWTSIAATVASAGSALGCCQFDLSDVGARRVRLKIVVGGTGGDVRISAAGKF